MGLSLVIESKVIDDLYHPCLRVPGGVDLSQRNQERVLDDVPRILSGKVISPTDSPHERKEYSAIERLEFQRRH